MEYTQLYSFNQNLHQYKYHSLAHHPVLPPLLHPLQDVPKYMLSDYQLHTSSHHNAAGDYLCRSHYMVRNFVPCRSLRFYQLCFWIVSKFQLDSIWKATVVRNLPIYGSIHELPGWIYSHILFVPFVLLQGAAEQRWQNVWLFQGYVLVNEINQLYLVPHICVRGMELFGGLQNIVAIRHPAGHNRKDCIWQLWDGTACLIANTVARIRWW